MNKIRNPREGVVQKYLNFLIELRHEIIEDPKCSVNDIIDHHNVGSNIVPALKKMNIISGTGRKGRQWIGRFPDYQMIQELRIQIKRTRESRINPFNRWKPSDLVHPTSGKQMGVGNVHYPKSRSRTWSLIKSITIFKYKFRIYKLK